MTSILLLGYFVALPLMFALSIVEGIDLHISRLVIIGIFAVFCAQGLFLRNFSVPRGSIAYVSAAILCTITTSLFSSDIFVWSARKAVYFWTFAPLFVVLVSLTVGKKLAPHSLVKAVVGGGVIASAVGVVQFVLQFVLGRDTLEELWHLLTPFFLGGTFSQSVATFNSWFVHVGSVDVFRAVGFFPDPHVAAFYTGMILPFAVGMWCLTRNTRWLVASILLLCANLLTFSRGGEMGLAAGVFTALLLNWRFFTLRVRHFILICAAVSALLFMLPNNPLTQRFTSSFSADDTSNTARIVIWSEALGIWQKSPLLGVGIGAYPFVVDPDATYRTPIYAHNIFLDIAVELGLVGLSLFIILIMRMLQIFLRVKSVISYCAIISMSIFLAHGMFDTPFFSVHVFPLILFLMALAAYYENTSPYKKRTKS